MKSRFENENKRQKKGKEMERRRNESFGRSIVTKCMQVQQESVSRENRYESFA